MIGYYAIAPYFICMAFVLTIASTPLFRRADSPPNPSVERISSIDGLRGFLALAVFFHHGTIYYHWLAKHVWDVPPSRFYTQLGQSGVAFFFMITGYLFWTRLLRKEGHINFLNLYIGRIFRIGPLDLFAVIVLLSIVLFHTGPTPHVSLLRLAHQIIIWLALGALGVGPDVNGYHYTSLILAGVTWTLHYEWLFYFSLIGTSYLARLKRLHFYFIAIPLFLLVVLFSMHYLMKLIQISFFLCGMLSGSLEEKGLLAKLPDWLSSTLVLFLLALDFTYFGSAYQAGPVILMAISFYLIVSGSNIFGLLVSQSAIRLGEISYGTYLLQGLVLYSMFSIPGVQPFAFVSPITYWAVILCCAVLLVTVAAVTHVAIERPGIELGKSFATTVAGSRTSLRSPERA